MPIEDNFTPMTDYKNPNGEAYPAGPNGRLDFSKISGHLALPYLVEIQTDSYKWFLQKGIDDVLREVFPIANYSNTLAIDYLSSPLQEPKYNPLTCKHGDLTYSSNLKVNLRLSFTSPRENKAAEELTDE